MFSIDETAIACAPIGDDQIHRRPQLSSDTFKTPAPRTAGLPAWIACGLFLSEASAPEDVRQAVVPFVAGILV